MAIDIITWPLVLLVHDTVLGIAFFGVIVPAGGSSFVSSAAMCYN